MVMHDFHGLKTITFHCVADITLYNVCSVHRGMFSTSGVFSTSGDSMSTLGDIMSISGDIMSTSRDVQYIGGIP